MQLRKKQRENIKKLIFHVKSTFIIFCSIALVLSAMVHHCIGFIQRRVII